jgi:hypothetical protein
MAWSVHNEIKGMTCTHIVEGADHHGGWKDNFLCLPPKSPFRFSWSSNGPIAESNQCVRWSESSDRATWHDNYLCIDPKTQPDIPNPLVDFLWNSAGPIEGMQCTQGTLPLLKPYTQYMFNKQPVLDKQTF